MTIKIIQLCLLFFLFLSLSLFSNQKNDKTIENIENSSINSEGGFELEALNSKFLSIIDDQQKAFIEQMFEKNPFVAFDDVTLKGLIRSFGDSTPLNKFFDRYPQHLDFLVLWLKDKEALKSLISSLKYPEKFKYFAYSTAAIFVFVFFLSLMQQQTLFKRLLQRFFLFIFLFFAQVSAFVIIFYEHLRPTFILIKNYYFN